MPRRRLYDLEELLAAWDSGDFDSAAAVMDFLGIPAEALSSVQKNLRKYRGSRPKRAAFRRDWLKQAVTKRLVEEYHLVAHYCSNCQTYCGTDVYLRQLGQDDDLATIVLVGKCCKRAGDY